MSINSTTKKVDPVTVIGLSGKITIGEECKHLRETIRGQLSEGTNPHFQFEIVEATLD